MKQLFFIAFLLQLSACVLISQQAPVSSPEELQQVRQLDLAQLKRWKINGRTVITQGREGWNAGIVWQEFDNSYQIKLQGPFAQGGITLIGNQEKVILTMNDGKKISSTDPEKLLYDVLQVHLPIYALRDWIRGLPHSSKEFESIEYDKQGRITHLVQQGWEINYLRYVPFNGLSMPSKIFIKHKDQRLRLIINRWRTTSLEQAMTWNITP